MEKKIIEVIRAQKNISFIISSSQNIDRIVSAYKACKKTGKTLVIDIYTAWVLEQVRKVTKNVPGMEWPEVRVYADYSQDQKLKDNPAYFGDFRPRLYRRRVKWQEMKASPSSFLYFGKMSSFRKIDAFKNSEAQVNVFYSQWQGYLDGSHLNYFGSDRIAAYREDPKVNLSTPIRHYGLLSNRFRKELLPLARTLLAAQGRQPLPLPPPPDCDLWHCPRCGAPMRVVDRFTAAQLYFAGVDPS